MTYGTSEYYPWYCVIRLRRQMSRIYTGRLGLMRSVCMTGCITHVTVEPISRYFAQRSALTLTSHKVKLINRCDLAKCVSPTPDTVLPGNTSSSGKSVSVSISKLTATNDEVRTKPWACPFTKVCLEGFTRWSIDVCLHEVMSLTSWSGHQYLHRVIRRDSL